MQTMNRIDTIPMQLEPRVQEMMEERGIREEDIHQVLSFAEREGLFHAQKETDHRLACFTPSKVTYWVEYGREEDRYRIYSAYSHRMKILEGFNMPSKKKPEEIGWLCGKCGLALELAAVKMAYLDENFVADLPACPSCQRVLVSEEVAVGKMALAERMLEDK